MVARLDKGQHVIHAMADIDPELEVELCEPQAFRVERAERAVVLAESSAVREQLVAAGVVPGRVLAVDEVAACHMVLNGAAARPGAST